MHQYRSYVPWHACPSTGSDFTVEGFEAVLEYLYTSAVQGATEGEYNLIKMHTVRQAADFFGLSKLADAVTRWARECGVNVDTKSWGAPEVEVPYNRYGTTCSSSEESDDSRDLEWDPWK